MFKAVNKYGHYVEYKNKKEWLEHCKKEIEFDIAIIELTEWIRKEK